ncbi:MAG: alpha/beta hydrolase [Pseudomonadota bacterium]
MTRPSALAAIALILAGALPIVALPEAVAQEPTRELEHEQVTVRTSEGLSLSAFITRPTGIDTPLPALFLTQWVSCGSIAPRPDRMATAERLALAANYALIRVDRSGSGESEGPGCDELDYDTEVRHYREALAQLRDHEWVQPDHIVIYGSSLGSTTAPLVAEGSSVAGVVVQGAGALTYYERMVHFDRLQLERQADFNPAEINPTMRLRMEFQHLYLHRKMTPQQIAEAYPNLDGVWESLLGTDAEPHYGRPHAWHWQAADANWLGAWTRIEAPVMVIFGEYEQFESRHGHRTIVDVLNRIRPSQARWLEIPQAGHGLSIYPDPVTAYTFEGGESGRDLFIAPVADWLKEIAATR